MNITCLQNVPSHQKIVKNGEIKYVLMKKVILPATTPKILMTKRYTHLWHECLAITNVQVKSMVTIAIDQLDFDLVATCLMTPEVSDFIPGSLEDTNKYIEVADGHHVTAKKIQYK